MSKLDSKSLKCVFLGYSQVQMGYRCYCPSFSRYLVFADVTFLGYSILLPNKVSEALAYPGWRSAMIEKMDALTNNGT